jgi:hypothetical protein
MPAAKSAKISLQKESSQQSLSEQERELRAELAYDDSETESATDLIAEPTPFKAEGEDFPELEGEE